MQHRREQEGAAITYADHRRGYFGFVLSGLSRTRGQRRANQKRSAIHVHDETPGTVYPMRLATVGASTGRSVPGIECGEQRQPTASKSVDVTVTAMPAHSIDVV